MSRYALPTAGSVTKLSIYLAPTGTAGSQVLEGIVYSDSSGAPATLLGTSSPLTFTSTSAAGWYELTFPTPLNLAAGNYWIGVITGATSNVAAFNYTTVTAGRDYNTNTYTSGPTSTFGTVTTDSEEMSLYATYTPTEPVGATSPRRTARPDDHRQSQGRADPDRRKRHLGRHPDDHLLLPVAELQRRRGSLQKRRNPESLDLQTDPRRRRLDAEGDRHGQERRRGNAGHLAKSAVVAAAPPVNKAAAVDQRHSRRPARP